MTSPINRPAALAFAWLVVVLALIPGVGRAAQPCAADIEKFCSKVPMGGGRIQACLKEHQKELSPECAARANVAEDAAAVAATCRTDITRFCNGVSPGGGRIAKCLGAHRDELSPECRDRLPQAGAAK